MGSPEDDAYWNAKYDVERCDFCDRELDEFGNCEDCDPEECDG